MKIALALAALLAVLLLGAVWLVTQPFAGAGHHWQGTAADAKRLEDLVRALVALGPREGAAGQAKVAVWLRTQLIALGHVPLVQYYARGRDDYRNLLVALGPQTPQRIVISAHYDARGPYPGADDDASGVAALLELARMLRGVPLPLHTELAFYSNEESGMEGSEFHARGIPAGEVRAMISLEMLGCFHEPQKFPLPMLQLVYPSYGDYIVVVGRFEDWPLVRSLKRALDGAGARVRSIDAPESTPGIGDSDHSSFWRAGARAAMLTDTAWYRNPRYHTAADTPDTLDYAQMAKVVDGVAAWASQVPR
ncbi:MAG TPA: M28 family peptidase [Myxococcales bacterium]|nr:M28 family peptidase [Myxococcales bacterium]